MQLKKSEEKTTLFRKEEYKLYKNINLVVKYTDNEITSQYIPCDFPNSNSFVYAKNKEEFLNLFKTKNFYDVYDYVNDLIVKDLKSHFEQFGFNKESLFNMCSFDHTLRTYQNKPIPIFRTICYISGFVEKDLNYSESYGYLWHWDDLREFLSNHKKVFNLKEITIPYYNRGFHGQRAFEFNVIYPESCGCDPVGKMIKFLNIDVKKFTK